VDRIKTPYLDEDLMVAYECVGTMTLIWKDSVPELFSHVKSVAATSPDDPFPREYIDLWLIGNSVTAQSIQHKAVLKAISKCTGFQFSMN